MRIATTNLTRLVSENWRRRRDSTLAISYCLIYISDRSTWVERTFFFLRLATHKFPPANLRWLLHACVILSLFYWATRLWGNPVWLWDLWGMNFSSFKNQQSEVIKHCNVIQIGCLIFSCNFKLLSIKERSDLSTTELLRRITFFLKCSCVFDANSTSWWCYRQIWNMGHCR